MLLSANDSMHAVRNINTVRNVIVECINVGYADTAKVYAMILARYVRRTIGWNQEQK